MGILQAILGFFLVLIVLAVVAYMIMSSSASQSCTDTEDGISQCYTDSEGGTFQCSGSIYDDIANCSNSS